MPFDSILALGFIALSIIGLLLKTHVGLGIMTALSTFFLVSINLFELQNFLSTQLSFRSDSSSGFIALAALSVIPALVVLFLLRRTVKGRFFAQIIPVMVFSLAIITILASVASNYSSLEFIEESFIVDRLSQNQNAIFLVSFTVGLLDVLTHYNNRDSGRKRNKLRK